LDDKCFLLLQFADIVQFQQLTGHYDAMTLQGGPSFKGAQYFKTEEADEGKRGGDNVLPIGAWYCSDVSDAEECKKIAIDANNWRFAA